MRFKNVYFITGNAYAGKSTMVKLLAQKYDGIACEENYHDSLLDGLDAKDFPCLTYTRDLQDWHDFIRRSPQEYKDWIDGGNTGKNHGAQSRSYNARRPADFCPPLF